MPRKAKSVGKQSGQYTASSSFEDCESHIRTDLLFAATDRRDMELEVLVATMQQTDFSLTEKMNLRQNAVIANQCDRWDYQEQKTEYGHIRMLSTDTKGVGVNRNLALQLAKADILLLADDDIVYYEEDLQGVIRAFQELPEADVIFFGIDMARNGEVFEKCRDKVKRVHIWNSLRYGACRMAVRRKAITEKRLCFSTLFGGGSIYGCGEDTAFICDCLREGLRLYAHSYVLGVCATDHSTWFSGFNEKYFFDRGALLACTFPKAKHLMKWYFLWRYSKKTELPLGTMLKLMNSGIKAFPEQRGYEEALVK